MNSINEQDINFTRLISTIYICIISSFFSINTIKIIAIITMKGD